MITALGCGRRLFVPMVATPSNVETAAQQVEYEARITKFLAESKGKAAKFLRWYYGEPPYIVFHQLTVACGQYVAELKQTVLCGKCSP